jgi:ankyrin repeat protein
VGNSTGGNFVHACIARNSGQSESLRTNPVRPRKSLGRVCRAVSDVLEFDDLSILRSGILFPIPVREALFGESIEFSLPSARREKRSRGRTTLFRPATIAWLLLPVLMSGFLLYKGLSHGESRIGLFDAAASGRSAAVLRALDSGYSVDASDINKWTILMHAVAAGDLDLVRVLLGRHANVNAQNSNGETALLLALWNRREDAAEILISNGANVELPNDRGQTALFSAAMHGDLRMCKLLLAHGADKTHRDQQGKTALDYAREEGHAEVVALLLNSTSASTTGNR